MSASRKLLQPSDNSRDRHKPAPKPTNDFSFGVLKDNAEIPDGALADAENVVVYPTEFIGRTGSELHTLTQIPAMPDRTGYSATKSVNTITTTTDVFTEDDVTNFFVWPGDPNQHDEIIEYISPTQVKVAYKNDFNEVVPGCYLRGRNNFFGFHHQRKIWIQQFYRQFYYSNIDMDSWTEVVTVSRDLPFNNISGKSEFDDYSELVFNANGIFKLDLEQNWAYKLNIPVPDIPIAPQEQIGGDDDTAFRYLYSAARLAGQQVIRNRLDPIRIESETGTNTEDIVTNQAGLDKVWHSGMISESNSLIVGPLWVPKVPNTSPQEYQWHLTHFPVYRTLETEGTYAKLGEANVTSRADFNNPNRFVWVNDLRICGAFYARKQDGLIIAEVGEFEVADVGSVVEWENGDRDEITEYIEPTIVRYAAGRYDYDLVTGPRAAEIGNGRVMRATQTGDVITRTHGSTFTEADVRRTITWSTGDRSVIKEYIDADSVIVYDTNDRLVQGLTLDPTYRYFNDTITDDQLRARLTTLLLRQRFWTPLPNSNVGAVAPGFLVTAIRNLGDVKYGQLPENYEFLAGFYNAAIQVSHTIKDDIQFMKTFPNIVVVWTSSKTYSFSTNVVRLIEVPGVGEAVAAIPGIDILDDDKGCFDWGSIRDIGNGEVMLLTSEPGFIGWRRFNGISYGPNEAFSNGLGRLNTDLNNLWNATASLYNGNAGLLLWGNRK